MAADLTLPETVTLSRASPEGELQTSADSGPLETIELVLCRLQQPLLGAWASRLSLFCHQLSSSELTKPAKDFILLQAEKRPELALCPAQLHPTSPQPEVSAPAGPPSVSAGGSE